MKSIEEWIRPFLKRYTATIRPEGWPDGSDPDEVVCFVEGWIEGFADERPPVTEAEADAARVRLAKTPPSWPRDHLPAVLAVVRGLRERDAAAGQAEATPPDPLTEMAARRSRGCPECSTATGPTGFARRRGMWSDRSWHATVALYCRCPLGRRRLAGATTDPPPYDDLQALPHLWDRSLSHPAWSHRPSHPCSVEGRAWRYMTRDEPAPPPIAAAVLPAARPSRPRGRSWGGPVPENLFMPRLVRPGPDEARAADEACEGERPRIPTNEIEEDRA